MRNVHVLLIGAASVAACAERGPQLREPVGQTMVTSSPPPSPPHDAAGGSEEAAAPGDPPTDVDTYLTGNGKGPCGMDELPVIAFASASTALDEPQASELRRLAGCLTAPPYEASSVVVIGYSDVIGTVTANLALGLQRARSVMRQLIDGGVSPARIVLASAGELQRPRARLGLRANRVEILVARGGPPRPDEAPIARGIDAEGLLPRPPREVVRESPSGQRVMPPPRPPIMYGRPPPGVVPRPAPRRR